ncbi:MAG: hypothetical protein JWN84_632 [Nocardioides sp.]|nr:hypothetical protein [Nocardioides sp.]
MTRSDADAPNGSDDSSRSDTASETSRLLRGYVDAATPATPPSFGNVLKRRRRRRTRRASMAAGAAALAAACTAAVLLVTGAARDVGPDVTAPSPDPATATDPAATGAASTAPPLPGLPAVPRAEVGNQPPEPVVLSGGNWSPVTVTSTCWQHDEAAFCADGMATPPYVTADDGANATFAFGLDGWSFTAVAQPLSKPAAQLDPCTRFLDVTVTPVGEAFQASVEGPAGRYLVHLQGQGPQGSVSSSFAWTTTADRPSPPARGYLALLTEIDGELDSYGVEVGLRGLDRGYPDATATATVTAADGSSQTYGPYTERDGNGCDDGSVFITSPRDQEWPTPELGPGPYQYRVDLRLGQQTYVGTAVWPRDERRDEAPNTDLVFDPPLPRYATN